MLGDAAFRAAGLRAQQQAVTLLTNEPSAFGPRTLPMSRGVQAYGEGFAKEALALYATIVDHPSEADVALIRLKTPWTPNGRGGMAENFHGGSLEFPPEELERIGAICQSVPTVIDIHFERPAVLGTLVDDAAAIVANYGIAESALLDVLFGEALPEGNLPFDLPRSMEAVIESRSDVPFDTVDPVFRFGHGLRYATPE